MNADIRCEARPIQIEEGISEEKMLLIQSKRGATWENIYSILFPGAPIPSPCKSIHQLPKYLGEMILNTMKTTNPALWHSRRLSHLHRNRAF